VLREIVLERAEYWSNNQTEESKEDEKKYYNFEAIICPDGYPYMYFENDDGREAGFFFSVTGVPANSNLRFQFPKLSN
jgi:hypothetical protein